MGIGRNTSPASRFIAADVVCPMCGLDWNRFHAMVFRTHTILRARCRKYTGGRREFEETLAQQGSVAGKCGPPAQTCRPIGAAHTTPSRPPERSEGSPPGARFPSFRAQSKSRSSDVECGSLAKAGAVHVRLLTARFLDCARNDGRDAAMIKTGTGHNSLDSPLGGLSKLLCPVSVSFSVPPLRHPELVEGYLPSTVRMRHPCHSGCLVHASFLEVILRQAQDDNGTKVFGKTSRGQFGPDAPLRMT